MSDSHRLSWGFSKWKNTSDCEVHTYISYKLYSKQHLSCFNFVSRPGPGRSVLLIVLILLSISQLLFQNLSHNLSYNLSLSAISLPTSTALVKHVSTMIVTVSVSQSITTMALPYLPSIFDHGTISVEEFLPIKDMLLRSLFNRCPLIDNLFNILKLRLR